MSSVDVHVSQGVRPMWDSGSIVSGRVGERDATTTSAVSISARRWMVTTSLRRPSPRLNRTLDSAKDSASCGHPRAPCTSSRRTLGSNLIQQPRFVHYTKPLNSDLFGTVWRSRPAIPSAYDGKDEVGISSGRCASLGDLASDSDGTVHAVLSVSNSVHGNVLYYHYAKQTMCSYNPYPVYEWDWTQHTPVRFGDGYDLRQPSLVCDANDRLHLAFRSVSTSQSHIIYGTKLPSEASFPSLPTFTEDPADFATQTWSKVNKTVSNPVVASDNEDAGTSHGVIDCDNPKVCLPEIARLWCSIGARRPVQPSSATE